MNPRFEATHTNVQCMIFSVNKNVEWPYNFTSSDYLQTSCYLLC